MRANVITLALLSCALLCGTCATTQAQQPAATPSFVESYQSAVAKAQEECNGLWADHQFDWLRTEIPLNGDKPTFSMLTNTEKLQAKDRPVADLAIKALEKCRAAWAPAYAMLPPQVSNMIHGVERQQDDLIARIYTGAITFGDFNVGMNELTGKLAEALSGVSNQSASASVESPKTIAPAQSQPVVVAPPAVFHDKRLALVIGNSNYVNLPKLANPANDARSIADVLKKLGYQTQLVLDASTDTLRNAVRKFARDSETADVALVYFSGHGTQLNGSSYLLPIDMDIPRTGADIQFTGLKIDDLANSIGANTKIIFLDACRDNPVLRSIVSGRGIPPVGLAPAAASNFDELKPGGGVFIAYATDAGAVAEDGQGQHSPFTEALLRYMQQPTSIDNMFSLVTREVRLVTKNEQRPYKYASLENIICLTPECSDAPPLAPENIVQEAQRSEEDELKIALQTNNPNALETYLQKYPDTPKQADLLDKIVQLKRAEFTEWTLFEVGELHFPQYMKLSSIQSFNGKAAADIKWAIYPSARQLPVFKDLPDAEFVDDTDVFDCEKPKTVTAESSVLNKAGQVIFHYKWGNPRFMSFNMPVTVAPGSTGDSARKILCFKGGDIPAVTKRELAEMSFQSLSSTVTGDGDLFYKVLPSGKADQDEKHLLFITRFNKEREVPLLAPNASIQNLPNFKTEVDRTVLNCRANRIFAFVNEYYDSSNRLVFLRPPIDIPQDVSQWQEIKNILSPISQLRDTICGAGEARQ